MNEKGKNQAQMLSNDFSKNVVGGHYNISVSNKDDFVVSREEIDIFTKEGLIPAVSGIAKDANGNIKGYYINAFYNTDLGRNMVLGEQKLNNILG